ncbi:retrovirus-related pol polyprotein from transposon TNT 1-94 [Tanacetum coccineum]
MTLLMPLTNDVHFCYCRVHLDSPIPTISYNSSSNPRHQAIIHDGRSDCLTVQGEKTKFHFACRVLLEQGLNISGICGNNSGQQRIVKCFNCQREGHTARQCPKLKRKRDATWFRDKADHRVAEGPVTQTVITHNVAYQADDLDAYDSDCDNFSTAKAVLMANLSSYGSNVLSEVPHFENTHNDMLNQSPFSLVAEVPSDQLLRSLEDWEVSSLQCMQRGGQLNAAPVLEVENFTNWKKRFLCHIIAKSTWDDLILYHEGPSDVKKSRVMDMKLCYNTFKFKEVLENIKSVKDFVLASLFGKLKYEENLIDNIYETEKNKSLVSTTPLSTAFLSFFIVQNFQDSPDNEEDTRSSQEYLNDLEEEYQARALLAKSKRFFKKDTQRFSSTKATDQTECHKCGKKGQFARDYWPTKDFEAKYNKVKAKLALLSSSASASKAPMVKNKGLIAIVTRSSSSRQIACQFYIYFLVYELYVTNLSKIISSITAQQTKFDLELVPKENRLDIGKCNGKIPRGLTPREPTFQVVMDAIALTPCYPAFLITVDICPRVSGRDIDALPFEEDTASFLRELGHTGEINSLNDVVVD